MYLLCQGSDGNWINTDLTASGTMPLNTWRHIAAVRDGNTFRLYVNGTSVISYSSSMSLNNTSSETAIGYRIGAGSSGAGSNSWQGYVDEFRVTKGVARWSGSTITVPAAAFPTS
jgi:hypothetical protein